MGHLEQGPSETEPGASPCVAWEAPSINSEMEPVSFGPWPREAAFCLPLSPMLHYSRPVSFQFLECAMFLPVG